MRHLVELHGGNVFADSAGLGNGATFTVELPIRALHVSPAAVKGASTVVDGEHFSPSPLQGLRVLVVDDDADSRLLLQSALESDGASVALAGSAASAFELLSAQRMDVLISDIGMPDEDGISLIKRLRAIPKTQALPAIALSAYARVEDVNAALAAGYQRHVAKPADIAQLSQVVAELIERVGARSP